ncbi:hypothetical protein QJS04_geneDACA020338 [Acorus gramineus]|uniref:Glycosyl hydrolase family 31 C-terminal domain-containing protein n=1 Tax=Acorus gramineus TaxID=55184 RepID=A0AAV9A8N9_ACOGR|nr:hypothetical protein QJS04_geneDACA020338 [Acorus gramineus]
MLRYRLLPYFYTLLYTTHRTGAPIMRPLFFEFPRDANTHRVDAQFILGKSVLVSPVLKPNKTTVRAYFPHGDWFNLFDYGKHVRGARAGVHVTLDAARDAVNAHVRGGLCCPCRRWG